MLFMIGFGEYQYMQTRENIFNKNSNNKDNACFLGNNILLTFPYLLVLDTYSNNYQQQWVRLTLLLARYKKLGYIKKQ